MSQHPTAKKSLGQNFLVDKHFVQKIVSSIAPEEPAPLLEIGPGTGALTRPLLEQGGTLLSLEKDTRMQEGLMQLQEAFPQQFHYQITDALEADWTQLTPSGSKLVGNLPYNIGTVIVTRALETPAHWQKLVFMLQKEVVLRICAESGSKDWGRLAIFCQLRADCKRLFDVPRGAFFPPPKITSSIVEITPLAHPRYPHNAARLSLIVDRSFQQRRKMLRASLKGVFADIEKTLHSLGISPEARPETLTLEDFCRLSLCPEQAA